MPHRQFDRFAVKMLPLSQRANKCHIQTTAVDPSSPSRLSGDALRRVHELAERIIAARRAGRPAMCAFGAHSVKNGLGTVLARLIEDGYLTHLATNGACIIHDWEFSHLGQSSENVQQNVHEGTFGNWQETGFYINLAINIGAYEGKGYGESVGAMIQNEGLTIPSADELSAVAKDSLDRDPQLSAAAADLLWVVRRFELNAGFMAISHPWKKFSVQAAAFRLGVPFTGHPMFGHDIIYNHPMNYGAAIGQCAQRDFLTYAQNISQLDGGVYLSVGSAVMSPMIFEKSLSMSQNIAIQQGRHIDKHHIFVVDLAACTWDWSKGEPPVSDPGYYLRYNKTFSRMGGTMEYLQADNVDFLLALSHALPGKLA